MKEMHSQKSRRISLPLAISAAILFSSSALLFAQVPNPSFENWTGCNPDDWASPNACGVFTPVTPSTTAHTGSFAVRGEVISFFGQAIAPFVQAGADATGFPVSERFTTVEGFYMFEPVGGDRLAVNVVFYKGEEPVGQGAVAISTGAATYTPFSVTVNYFGADVPDRAIIGFQIFGPNTGSDYHLGSVMHIDSIGLKNSTTPPPAPSLSIQRVGNSIRVTWPAATTGFKLQTTLNLTNPSWTDVQGVQNNSYLAEATGERYFRLIEI